MVVKPDSALKNNAGRTEPWTKTIHGQPYSKANSRRLCIVDGKISFIKSAKALKYLQDFARQCPVLDPLFKGDVHVYIEIYYQDRRPDLDESLILDALQGRVYRNDRQVRAKTIRGGVDRQSPRAVIRVEAMEERAGAERERPVRGRRAPQERGVRVDDHG
jgi:Holliday junction resolvase RusA-like endonuclease